MQALGFIETRGLLAAIESTDAMLKAADVTFVEKTYVGGGLVSVAITGGVSAVKAAVEAGAAAVNHLNAALLVSQHVIPRPHEEVNGLLRPAITEEMISTESPGIKEADSSDISPEEIKKEYFDKLVQEQGLDKALEALSKIKVVKLRSLAREYADLKIAGRLISKADKKVLLDEFKDYYSKNE